MLALFAAVAFAAVDASKATPAELEGVKGVGEGNAAKFSIEGLTVNGVAFAGAPAKAAAPAAPVAAKK